MAEKVNKKVHPMIYLTAYRTTFRSNTRTKAETDATLEQLHSVGSYWFFTVFLESFDLWFHFYNIPKFVEVCRHFFSPTTPLRSKHFNQVEFGAWDGTIIPLLLQLN